MNNRVLEFLVTALVTSLPFVLVAVVVLVLGGCGMPGEQEHDERTHIVGNCSVQEIEAGANISCPDGTSVVIMHGTDGKDGADGEQGEQGEAGEDGEDGLDGADGEDGQDGIDGKNGRNATPSEPIYVGYYCGRTVIKIHKTVYILNSGLVRLSDKWYNVSNSCKVRYRKGKVEQG